MEPLNLLYDSFKHKNYMFIINYIASFTMSFKAEQQRKNQLNRFFFF